MNGTGVSIFQAHLNVTHISWLNKKTINCPQAH